MDNPKDKIAKLLAMANDGRGNEFEAEAALRQAEKLMRKHGIEAGELADHTGTKPIYKWHTVSVPDKLALRDEVFGAFATHSARGARVRSFDAERAGRAAGDRASLNRPIGSTQNARRLGGGS